MIDVKLIRENPALVRENLKRRGDPENLRLLEEFIEYDKAWRRVQTELNEARRRRNEISREIARLKKAGLDASNLMAEAARISREIERLERVVREYGEKARRTLMRIPNLLHESVPYGLDESDNVEIRRWGSPPKFDFKPKNHLEIALDLGLIDEERANKVAGSGFYYLKDELVLLDMAIQRFAIDFLRRRGYTLIEPPFMLRRKPYEGVTDLADFETVMYKIEGEDLYLIATSEHPIAAMFMDETLDMSDLPIKIVGVSTNFRKEVGTHGKYTKGLFRMHQFNKVEQFIFCLPEQSWELHEELQRNCEEMYQMLGLHYRVVNVCTGDIGTVAAKKYDTEVWMVDGKFREIGSNSNCTDYQARRLRIRFREGPGRPPKGFVHTLNSTALATSRTMMAILEHYQQKDGSVIIPEVLRPYMNGIERLERKE
ncbi:serine--tRNA ligase [Candidatus Bathyarchaeota archaeon]|nr:MAG: serine--tRNA ligase [Candidatus Bathyarchaeota archaeon]RLG97580.1 MAG: serine--tRNA ligase [Candidatus Bathyarchaeota archaeon]